MQEKDIRYSPADIIKSPEALMGGEFTLWRVTLENEAYNDQLERPHTANVVHEEIHVKVTAVRVYQQHFEPAGGEVPIIELKAQDINGKLYTRRTYPTAYFFDHMNVWISDADEKKRDQRTTKVIDKPGEHVEIFHFETEKLPGEETIWMEIVDAKEAVARRESIYPYVNEDGSQATIPEAN